jgi:hypothetical protein
LIKRESCKKGKCGQIFLQVGDMGDLARRKAKKKGREDERGNLYKKIILGNEKEGRDRES